MFPMPDPAAAARWLVGENDSGAEIPEWSLVRVTATDAEGVFTIDEPDEDGQAVWVTGALAIADGKRGAVTCDWPAWAAYDPGDGTPAVGETWGAGSGSHLLRLGNAGFRICGTPDEELEIVLVEPDRAGGGASAYYTNPTGNGVFAATQIGSMVDVPADSHVLAWAVGQWLVDPSSSVRVGFSFWNTADSTPTNPTLINPCVAYNGATGGQVQFYLTPMAGFQVGSGQEQRVGLFYVETGSPTGSGTFPQVVVIPITHLGFG